ncbi:MULTISPECIES: hypothetical protein [Providencia]|uniref:hypothetical protein n=1 Tax=Providencia TaxID=586 RepID=UPI001E4AE66B|nr:MULTISPECIES: hypothetical protein [Providencia]MDQ5990747.1 hypothetical protein [Providencia stuartii]MDT1066510.1 hypothetical protein [Providencia stuartii]
MIAHRKTDCIQPLTTDDQLWAGVGFTAVGGVTHCILSGFDHFFFSRRCFYTTITLLKLMVTGLGLREMLKQER